ncbi:unnamed protein product [Ectocarpus sp. CCAP 1310/34]|nr:unnamed protein product [Ectocarpus sp. CCAP 1310/34]
MLRALILLLAAERLLLDMGWFGLGRRKPAKEGAPSSPTLSTDGINISTGGGAQAASESTARSSTPMPEPVGGPKTTLNAPAAAMRADACDIASPVEKQQEQQQGEGVADSSPGYAHRLKAAFLDTVVTAQRAPETLEEAMAVIKGERAVKPDYVRAVGTVSAAFAGGCAHGWWHGAALAAKYPPHQRSIVRVRAGARRGLRLATFALIYEGSSAVTEALRRKKDFVGGTVGGALAGMAYGFSYGMAAARSHLFYGFWLGGVFSLFRNHVASLREQARLAEEDKRLAQEERDAIGATALRRSIAEIDAQLRTWPTAAADSEDETDTTELASSRRTP